MIRVILFVKAGRLFLWAYSSMRICLRWNSVSLKAYLSYPYWIFIFDVYSFKHEKVWIKFKILQLIVKI